MNNTNNHGYFTEEQMDRANLKTMANPLPVPWNGHHLLALLVYTADLGVTVGDLSPAESKHEVIDWYCTTPVEGVVKALEILSTEPGFQMILQFQELMHSDPEAVERALHAIRNGWRPGDPKA